MNILTKDCKHNTLSSVCMANLWPKLHSGPSKQYLVFCVSLHVGKTRTREKYRVVYTDHQRLELEKEFHYNRYITIRRKSELAANLRLSERQVGCCVIG